MLRLCDFGQAARISPEMLCAQNAAGRIASKNDFVQAPNQAVWPGPWRNLKQKRQQKLEAANDQFFFLHDQRCANPLQN